MRNLFAIGCFLIVLSASAQTGLSVGTSIVKGFGVPKVNTGLHLGIEIPRDDEISLYLRATMTLKNFQQDSLNAEAIDPTTTFPQQQYADVRLGSSYFNFEGGTRYYLGNGYDYGWSAYGGSIFGISVNSITRQLLESLDESKYRFIDSSGEPYADRGSILAMYVGLNAGVKNHFSFGMLYFDISASYSLLAFPSNTFAQAYNRFSPVMFSFNVGYRKDIF